ncbi:MAG TPA: anti-sigma factor [Trebonia sp.]|nr:anti-sigma factor [Trebonia sp.]
MSAQHHELHLLTGSYALDALNHQEQASFERHLSRCPACAEEVRGMREAAARLGMATAVTPPAAMRARVLAAVPRTRQLPPGPAGGGRRAALRRLPLGRTGLGAGFLALAAAVAWLAVGQASTNDQLQQARASRDAVAAVLAAPDAHVATRTASVGGTVTAVISEREHEAVITTGGVPSLTAARVYQLWVITSGGTATSAGLLQATSPGLTSPALAAGVQAGDQLGITVEPAGGTRQPTTKPVVLVPVTD